MHLDAATQAAAKQNVFYDALARIGGLSLPPEARRPIRTAAGALAYRRRARLTVRGKSLGFTARSSHRLVEIERCAVLSPALDRTLGRLSEALAAHGPVPALTHISLLSGEDAVALGFHLDGRLRPSAAARMRAIARGLELAAVATDGEGEVLREGDPVVRVGRSGRVPLYGRPDLFLQAHDEQNKGLAGLVVEALGDARRVLELFGGAGNFTFDVAAAAGEVVAVEQSAAAVEMARRSSREGQVTNIRWISGDWSPVSRGLAAEGQTVEAILLDPPRGGAPGVGRAASALGARRVVYVSCDPATLARDARDLTSHGYRVAWAQPVDMFPQTFHVEGLVRFDGPPAPAEA